MLTPEEEELAKQELMQSDPKAREIIIMDELAKQRHEAAQKDALDAIKANFLNIRDLPAYLPEDVNPNTLFKGGPWLERGGAAFIIGTAGIGKSIFAMQFMLAIAAGISFCGLLAQTPLRVSYIQSEDSPNRMAHDLADCLAELKETNPDVDWDDAMSRFDIYNLVGKTGAEFLAALDDYLTAMETLGKKVDLVVINPLLAFIGGAITDSAYVTPFLRGGRMPDGTLTDGLQRILERHGAGAVIFHHTPKPPTEKEIDAWMKSTFPEYQGAGSSDITNWGRSFLMMMRVKSKPGFVCVTAGKNGSRLGWEQIGGAYRHYLAYSGKQGVEGLRNAWRELTEAEYAAVVNAAKTDAEKDEAAKKVTDIAPYVTQVLDHARASFLGDGMEFKGLTQDAMAQAVRTAIQMDGKVSFEVRTLKKMLDDLPPSVVIRKGRKPLWYGTKEDLKWHS